MPGGQLQPATRLHWALIVYACLYSGNALCLWTPTKITGAKLTLVLFATCARGSNSPRIHHMTDQLTGILFCLIDNYACNRSTQNKSLIRTMIHMVSTELTE